MEQPQAAATETYAGFWIRLWASFIDTMLLACIVGPPIYLIYGPAYLDEQKVIAGWADFLLTWVFPAIAVTVFWVYKSATPGKMVAGLRIIDARTKQPPSAAQCVVRYLGYYLSMLPVFLGFIWVAIDGRKQGWHDKIAKTLVVKT